MDRVPIPLFTSLPPRIKRIDAKGNDIGEDYAMACVQSWVSSGFFPVTVNSRMEDSSVLLAHEAIEKRQLDRDARVLYGRPFPYLSDIVQEMRRYGPGIVALTNADIMLRLSAESQRTIRELMPGQCVVCKRIDVNTPEARQGRVYSSGFDFFAFRTEDLAGLDTGELALGVPWWDHFLPLWFYLRGINRILIDSASVIHLAHEERWDKAMWFSVGAQILPMLSSQFEAHTPSAPRVARYFADAQRVQRVEGIDRLPYVVRMLSASGRESNAKKILNRLSNLNIATIDSWNSHGIFKEAHEYVSIV